MPTHPPSRRLLLATAAALLAAAPMARADTPGRHPFYIHALTDLRTARWLLLHNIGNFLVNGHEDEAIHHIEAAIGDIKRAAIEDGKNLDEHPPIDVPPERVGVLRRALELLHGVRRDVTQPEDDPAGLDAQTRSLRHVEEAIHHVERAIADA
jgi:hypothetical protein